MNFLEAVEKAGVVGCGGAGFPAHIKWNAKADYFIVNAVECEPLLSSDKYLMRNRAEDIVCACRLVAESIGAENTIIAVKAAYEKEIDALRRAIEVGEADIRIHEMDSFYPAGDEQVVVYEATGRNVPCGGIPLDVGAVVSNIATLVAAFEAEQGIPLIEKYITIAGEVVSPTMIKAPLGTPVAECIEAAGGAAADDYMLIAGGPMMGRDITGEEEDRRRTDKTMSGILVLPKDGFMSRYKTEIDLHSLKKKAAAACMQCSFCTLLCPRHLLGHPLYPHLIMRAIGLFSDPDQLFRCEHIKNAALCSLCGVCTAYSCPMGLQPSKINAFLKEEMAKKGIKRAAGEQTVPLRDREWRKIPTERISARIGVEKYIGKVGDHVIRIKPDEVAIALKQGPGNLPKPVVSVGDCVAQGQLIATIAAGTMGANLHASIEGTVTEVSDVIRIRRR